MSDLLNREAFLDAPDPRVERVETPEFGEGSFVFVGMLSAEGAERVVGLQGSRPKSFGALMVALCACDEQGNKLFTEDDADALAKKPGDVINRIATAALKHNGMTPSAVEDAEKNSDATQ